MYIFMHLFHFSSHFDKLVHFMFIIVILIDMDFENTISVKKCQDLSLYFLEARSDRELLEITVQQPEYAFL